MKEALLKNLDPKKFGLTESDFLNLDERTVVVKKWNWDYGEAHAFQRALLPMVQESTSLRVLITCSHPKVLTNGRGLQKPRKGETLNLQEFRPEDHQNLPYPLFQIERGGGLTFHHPGQFIFYPILKLNPKSLSLSRMTDEIFDFSIDVLKEWNVKDLHHENKLLGLWYKDQKLASMGIAIEKLTTFHGMALNIKKSSMIENLSSLNPCGLTTSIYTSVEELTTLPDKPLDTFQEQFLQRVRHEWK